MKNIFSQLAIVTSVLAIVLMGTWAVFNYQSYESATAQTTFATLGGFAWASTGENIGNGTTPEGIGWISMNCADGGPGRSNICATSNYRVEIESDRTLSGYAWMGGNVDPAGVQTPFGWIQFGGLTGCPSGGNCDARIISDGADGWEMTGWARALSYQDTQNGGWDGWISLNCANTGTCGTSDYAIRIDSVGNVQSAVSPAGSFAYGAMVVGWVDFGQTAIRDLACTPGITYSCVGNTSNALTTNLWCEESTVSTDCAAAGYACNGATGLCDTTQLIGTFTVTPPIIRRDESAQITWDFPGATTCDVTGPGTDLIADGIPTGSGTTAGITQNQSTFTLVCDGNTVGTQTIRLLPTVYES